jgi:hypothetical protein
MMRRMRKFIAAAYLIGQSRSFRSVPDLWDRYVFIYHCKRCLHHRNVIVTGTIPPFGSMKHNFLATGLKTAFRFGTILRRDRSLIGGSVGPRISYYFRFP